ncbi:unnamed protein product [Boreogadus saida]
MDPANPGDVTSGSVSRWVQMAQEVHRLGVPVEGYPQNLGEVDSALTHLTAYRVTFDARHHHHAYPRRVDLCCWYLMAAANPTFLLLRHTRALPEGAIGASCR